MAQSPDGRLVVAALRDGTVRWYRASDGVELLALFVHSDGKRWVAFTASGYYAPSAAGEDLVGWQVDNGPDQAASFFPASRFRDYFYRPDVVSLVLKTLDEAEAVRRAEAATAQHEAPRAEAAEQTAPVQHEAPASAQETATVQPEAPAPAEQTAPAQHEAPTPAQETATAQHEAPAPEAANQAPAAQPEPPKPEAAEQASAAQPDAPAPAQGTGAAQHEAAPDAAEGKQALLSEQPPAEKGGIAQPESAAAPAVAGLPAFAPVRVVLNVARDDVGHHRRATDIRQALAAAGLEVADHVPVDAKRPGPSIGYYFQSDRKSAAEVSHLLEPLLGPVDPAAIRQRASIPEPGTIEVAIP